MPPFTVLRIQKLKTWGAIAGAAKHNQRERETPNADEAMRDGLRCLAAAGTRLYYWGLRNVARSTFADANNSRPVGFFQDLFGEMYALCAQAQIPLQIQAVQHGCNHHQAMPVALSVGCVSAEKRRRQNAHRT